MPTLTPGPACPCHAFPPSHLVRVQAGLPSRVHLVWAARQPREFCILDADLLAAAL